jgi:hypothetical protein
MHVLRWAARTPRVLDGDSCAYKQNKLREQKPWATDPKYFKHVKISALALLKMVTFFQHPLPRSCVRFVLPFTFICRVHAIGREIMPAVFATMSSPMTPHARQRPGYFVSKAQTLHWCMSVHLFLCVVQAMHARSGGQIEVMGMLQGKLE